MADEVRPVILCDPDKRNPVIVAPRGYESMTEQQLAEYVAVGREMLRELKEIGAVIDDNNG